MMVVVVTKYVEIALKSQRELDWADSSKYEAFHIFVSIEEINTISLAICDRLKKLHENKNHHLIKLTF